MPSTNWNVTTINGKKYLVIDVAQFRIPLDWDPTSNMFIAVAAPVGGVGNFPALVKGDPGDTPALSDDVNFVSLEADDPTSDSASLTQIGPNLYQLNLALHKGDKGDAGTVEVLAADDVNGTGTPGQILVVNPAADGMIFTSPRVGDRYVPASIKSVPTGNPAYTLCPVLVPAMPWDWRPDVAGQCVVKAQIGLDLAVDLIARLSNNNQDGGETTGNEVGRAFGLPLSLFGSANQILVPGPPPGSADAYDRVRKGQNATIFFRTERQSGIDTYSTDHTTTRFSVRVRPCPTDAT